MHLGTVCELRANAPDNQRPSTKQVRGLRSDDCYLGNSQTLQARAIPWLLAIELDPLLRQQLLHCSTTTVAVTVRYLQVTAATPSAHVH